MPTESMARRWSKIHQNRYNGVPLTLLALYFLVSFAESFPLTAYSQWVNYDLKMPPSTQVMFYSAIFIPWSLKPLYGFILDHFPICGYRRKIHAAVCCLGYSVMFLMTATAVYSIELAFMVTIARASFSGFLELLATVSLLDVCGRDPRNTARVQSMATAVRYSASLLALLLGLPLYSCGQHAPSPRLIIGFTSVVPLLALVCSLFLPDDKRARCQALRPEGWPLLVVALCTQSVAVWISVKPLVAAWWVAHAPPPGLSLAARNSTAAPDADALFFGVLTGLGACLALAGVAALLCHCARARTTLRAPACEEVTGLLGPAAFIFIFYALPSSAGLWGSYEYFLLASSSMCYIQFVNGVSCVAAIVASVFYARCSRRWRRGGFFTVMVVSTASRALVTMLKLPLSVGNARCDSPQPPEHVDWWAWDAQAMGCGWTFFYVCVCKFLDTICSTVSLIAIVVLAATRSMNRHSSGTTLAVLFAVLDAGDCVSGFVTAPIVRWLGLTLTYWKPFGYLLVTDASVHLLALLMLPLALLRLPRARTREPEETELLAGAQCEQSLTQISVDTAQNF